VISALFLRVVMIFDLRRRLSISLIKWISALSERVTMTEISACSGRVFRRDWSFGETICAWTCKGREERRRKATKIKRIDLYSLITPPPPSPLPPGEREII
jgi:hypothetical protein